MPYYTIPSQYTSLTCYKCKQYSNKNRKSGGGEKFKCVSCGHEDISHNNAALIIRERAIEFYENKCMFGSCLGRSMKISIMKNLQLQDQINFGGSKVVKKKKQQLQAVGGEIEN